MLQKYKNYTNWIVGRVGAPGYQKQLIFLMVVSGNGRSASHDKTQKFDH
jgi:hypothetical protein